MSEDPNMIKTKTIAQLRRDIDAERKQIRQEMDNQRCGHADAIRNWVDLQRGPEPGSVLARFMEKVFIPPRENSECWEWIGGKEQHYYGIFWLNGKNRPAHRVSYELFVGRIDPCFVVMHKCDNPGCVNPEHLEIGTRHSNNADCRVKGRQCSGGRRRNIQFFNAKDRGREIGEVG